jgi:hypothetical protein
MTRIISVLLVLAGLTALASSAAAGQFKAPRYYKINSVLPDYVIAADFNNDGILDLAVGAFGGKVAILLGRGDGQFDAARYFSAGSAVALAAGDFDGDGNLDLAVVEYGGTGYSALGIFLGDGKGNFRSAGTYQLGIESNSIVVADFNHDGHLDIAVTNELGYGKGGKKGGVLVFFGKGDGKFGKPATYILPNYPYGVAAGDFNGDGYPDLAVAEAYDGLAILSNNGHGKFKHTATYDIRIEPEYVAVADLNHDSALDLVVVGSGDLAVLLGNGDGTFGKPTIYPLNSAPETGVAIADFNLDGNLDIAVPVSSGTGTGVELLYGNGDGTFQNPIQAGRVHGSPHGIVAGNFGKGRAPDLAVPDYDVDDVAIFMNSQ